MKNSPNKNPNFIQISIDHHIPTTIVVNIERIKIEGTVLPKRKKLVPLARTDVTKILIKKLIKTLRKTWRRSES